MLARAHLSIRGDRAQRMTKPNPALLIDVVSAKVLGAWKLAADALLRAGVRHIVIGGLAVGANGYPRATRDVDFLVGEEAFDHHPGGIVTMNPALPIEVDGVPIDYLSPKQGEDHLAAVLAEPPNSIVDAPRLVYMKLTASRLRDRTDVVELIKRGLDVDACRSYLDANAPTLVASFDDAVARATAEE
jgi:hypothetical protein